MIVVVQLKPAKQVPLYIKLVLNGYTLSILTTDIVTVVFEDAIDLR